MLTVDIKLKQPAPSDFETPRFSALLIDPNAGQLIRGMRLMTETRALLPQHVGNDLNCSSCHLNGGTVAKGLAERINGCFKRSMNGKPLPATAPDLQAMVAYIDWMKGATRANDKVPGRGVAGIDKNMLPNTANGQKVFGEQCAVCHGINGEGIKGANGTPVFPPLWGDRSFNIGPGMARTYTAAGFVKANVVMPPLSMYFC